MALLPASAAIVESQGQNLSTFGRKTYITVPGDAAYVSGGSVDFGATFLQAFWGENVTVTWVDGFGLSAGGDKTHTVRYDVATDALLVFDLTGAEEGAGDLSATTFHLHIFAE